MFVLSASYLAIPCWSTRREKKRMYDSIRPSYCIVVSLNTHITALDAEKQPSVVPFWRTYESEDRFSFLINTQTIFANLPDPKKNPVVQFSREEISCTTFLYEYPLIMFVR